MVEKDVKNKTMYDLNCGIYSGVFVPEHVKNAYMEISQKWSEEVKQLLNENKEEIFSSNWTMWSEKDDNGETIDAEYIKYTDITDTIDTVDHRIDVFNPKPLKPVEVYFCNKGVAEGIAQKKMKARIKEE